MGCGRTAPGRGSFRIVLDLVLLSRFLPLNLKTPRIVAFVGVEKAQASPT
jgi:hypothetical protein